MKKISILSVAMVILTALSAVSARAGELIIIANKSVAVSSVTKDNIRYLFMGQSLTWPDNTRAFAVVQKQGKTHETFCNDYLDRSPAQYDLTLKMMIYTGKGWLPKAVDSGAGVVQFVRQTRGAVGYIDADIEHGGVKTIKMR